MLIISVLTEEIKSNYKAPKYSGLLSTNIVLPKVTPEIN